MLESALSLPSKSAYICFSNAIRGQVKQANPGLDQASTMSRIAEMWRSMDARQKAKYESMAAKDQQRYQAEKAAYEKKTKGARR